MIFQTRSWTLRGVAFAKGQTCWVILGLGSASWICRNRDDRRCEADSNRSCRNDMVHDAGFQGLARFCNGAAEKWEHLATGCLAADAESRWREYGSWLGRKNSNFEHNFRVGSLNNPRQAVKRTSRSWPARPKTASAKTTSHERLKSPAACLLQIPAVCLVLVCSDRYPLLEVWVRAQTCSNQLPGRHAVRSKIGSMNSASCSRELAFTQSSSAPLAWYVSPDYESLFYSCSTHITQ
jgi:hypothetical protein